MAGALACGPAFRHRKADSGAERDPVGVLAADVVAIDQVDRKYLVRTVAHAGLESRPHHAWNIRLAGLTVGFDGPLQGVGEFPVEADPVGEVVLVDGSVPQPAAVEVNTRDFGQPERRRD